MQTLKLTKKYEKYPEYKNSGIQWLGTVPENWEVLRGKTIFRNEKDINKGMKNDNVLSLTMGGVINRDKDNNDGLLPSDYQTFQIFEKNDLVFKLIDLDNYKTSRVGLVHEKGIMSSAYIRLIANDDRITPKYFYYLYYHFYIRGIYNILGSGVRSTLNPDDLMNMDIVLPTANEQKNIIKYLDEKTALIDQIIEKKEKQIELLKERETSYISSFFNKQQNKIRLKFIGKAIIGLTYSPEEVVAENGGTLVLRSSNVQNDVITFTDNVYVSKVIPNELTTRIGDILICSRNGSRSLIGKNALIDEHSVGVTFGAFMTIFRTKHYRYVSHFLKSNQFKSQLSTTLTSTINQLTTYFLNNIDISLPDEVEQLKISDQLDLVIKNNKYAMCEIEKTIELMKEFKASLISNVVTGKIRV